MKKTLCHLRLSVVTTARNLMVSLLFVFTAIMAPLPAYAHQKFCADSGLSIPDGSLSPVKSSLEVPDLGKIAGLQVEATVYHSHVGELVVTLTHEGENGAADQWIHLLHMPGKPAYQYGCAGENLNARFDDDSDVPAEDTCEPATPTISGWVKPAAPLSTFSGKQAGGVWVLKVYDPVASGNTGYVGSWCIDLDIDNDSDGDFDVNDNCPAVPNPDQLDADHDNAGDVCDPCPNSPYKAAPGVCGCNQPDLDIDGDGDVECNLLNPANAMLTRRGLLLVPFPEQARIAAFDPGDGALVDDNLISSSTKLKTPQAAVLAPDQKSYLVSDSGLDVIQQFSVNGTYLGVWAPAAGAADSSVFSDNAGMAVIGKDKLLVSSSSGANADAVVVINKDKSIGGVLVKNKLGGLSDPSDLLISSGVLYVAGRSSERIHRYKLDDGAYVDNLAQFDGKPSQISLSAANTMLVAVAGYWEDEGIWEIALDKKVLAHYKSLAMPLMGYNGVIELKNGKLLVASAVGVEVMERSGGEISERKLIDSPAGIIKYAVIDKDLDGTGDSLDKCPGDPAKTQPGSCGCGIADVDSDNDGVPQCVDQCPMDPQKAAPGACGCGMPDSDFDGDQTPNCTDSCPLDPQKASPGVCGCFKSDVDANKDGIADCLSRPDKPNTSLDSDQDGVSDAQEALDGTNPGDKGSVLQILDSTVCSEWNGFLGGMWNIMEHVNMGNAGAAISSTLYSIDGKAQGALQFNLPAGAQYDLLVHDMAGWSANSYGKVCSTAAPAQPGALDGRMVYYKPVAAFDPVAPEFEFAFAMSFENGKTGAQYATFNTYQPSYDPKDAANLVANWVQITNLSSSPKQGTLSFYGPAGALLAAFPLALEAQARFDVAAHQFGPNQVGLVEWLPGDSSALFLLRNVRYYYNNAGATDSFDAAFQIEGTAPSGQVLSVPLDSTGSSAVVEVANAGAETQQASVEIYNAAGLLLGAHSEVLAPHQSVHIIADQHLLGGKGIALVKGGKPNSIVAVAMQYERTALGAIATLYGIVAREALGTTLRGSFNTYLGQACRLLVTNPGASAVEVSLEMEDDQDKTVLTNTGAVVPAHGLLDYDLCSKSGADHYGVVTLLPEKPNSVYAQVLRIGYNNSYRFPTPVRQ